MVAIVESPLMARGSAEVGHAGEQITKPLPEGFHMVANAIILLYKRNRSRPPSVRLCSSADPIDELHASTCSAALVRSPDKLMGYWF